MNELSLQDLREPWMIVAFEGWNDAADAATGAVDHLIEEWDAVKVATLDPEDYYDFQINRPVLNSVDGERIISWPVPALYAARPEGSKRDVLLLRSIEPNLRWQTFSDELVDIAVEAGVCEVYTLGAMPADTPHTHPIIITGSTTDPVIMERLSLKQSTYTGPIGINAVFTDTAARAGIATASLWAAVPHYLADPPAPKATLALLGALEDATGIALPQGLLPDLAQAWQRGADEVIEADEDLADYVRSLEDESGENLPGADGDAIAREFERYLRRRRPDDTP